MERGTQIPVPVTFFGGKSRIAHLVWERFGNVPNYVESFAGSLAVLLKRPHKPRTETVNDLDGFIANFWRALSLAPEEVARYADWPVNENDLHARHAWLVERRAELASRLEGDPDYYDARIAGYWVWGISCWIGSGWCSGKGPWRLVDGKLVRTKRPGIECKRPSLAAGGKGIKRQLPYLSGFAQMGVHKPTLQGITRQLPDLMNPGRGINRKRPNLGGHADKGVNKPTLHSDGSLYAYFQALSTRLRRVRVCCGDWSRIVGPSPTFKVGLTGVFLDPPYGKEATRDPDIYAQDSLTVAAEVACWAIENGDNPLLRIAVCGYEGEHEFPESWECVAWKAPSGYDHGKGQGAVNRGRERIWFSPHCLSGVKQERLL